MYNESYKSMSSYKDPNNDNENEFVKPTRESLIRFMNKDKKRSYNKKKKISVENIARAMVILINNGLDQDDAFEVLEAIGYALLDENVFPDLVVEELEKRINELRENK